MNVLHSFVDARNEAEVLDGTGKCSFGFCWVGLDLDELAAVVRRRGRQVEVLRDLTPEAFRALTSPAHHSEPKRLAQIIPPAHLSTGPCRRAPLATCNRGGKIAPSRKAARVERFGLTSVQWGPIGHNWRGCRVRE